jgi:hypothetical protein
MNGGLGNQTFQYIFARYLEETNKARVYIDDLHFFLFEDEIKNNLINKPVNHPGKIDHNGYELEYVFPNIEKPLLLSEFFEPDVWRYMVDVAKKSPYQRLSITRQLLDNGLDMSIVVESGVSAELSGMNCPMYKTPGNSYNTAVTKITGDIYYYGYWINHAWFNRYRDILIKDLSFKPIEDSTNKQYESAIKGNFSIGLHIRRGDFVRLNFALPESYYSSVISDLSSRHQDASYLVFSDDPQWCKEQTGMLGLSGKNVVFVEGNYDYKNNYIDMQLMAMCNVLIVGNSSFSYLASLLNQTPGFQAIQMRSISTDDAAVRPVRFVPD